MLFGKKDDVVVKYQVKLHPNGFELKKKKVSKEKLEELQNDPDIKILEIIEK